MGLNSELKCRLGVKADAVPGRINQVKSNHRHRKYKEIEKL